MTQDTAPDSLRLAVDVARRVIENGGETYRAEELLLRTARVLEIGDADGFVTPTGIIASGRERPATSGEGGAGGGTERSLVRRIERRSLDLGAICRIEDLVRLLERGVLTRSDFERQLSPRTAPRRFELAIKLTSGAFIAASFALLFGGGDIDFVIGLVVGPIVVLLSYVLDRGGVPPYFANMAGAALVVALASAGVALVPGAALEALTAGPLMLLVPGIAITNSVRDTIEGDLVSGLARGIEAFLLAAALAVGAGSALKLADILSGWAR